MRGENDVRRDHDGRVARLLVGRPQVPSVGRRVVPEERLDAEALGTAQRVAGLAPQAARLNKQMLRALKVPLTLDGKAQAAIENIVNGASDPYAYADSAEHREGINAFLAKRPPAF